MRVRTREHVRNEGSRRFKSAPLRENAALPPEARLSVKDIYERVRDEEGFRGGYR
jgi:hypothetical protein